MELLMAEPAAPINWLLWLELPHVRWFQIVPAFSLSHRFLLVVQGNEMVSNILRIK